MILWILVIVGVLCCLYAPIMPIYLLWVLISYYVILGGVGVFKLTKKPKLNTHIFSVMMILISIICLTLTQSVLFRKIGDENTGYSNLKRIRKALDGYLKESDGICPPAEAWCDHLLKVSKGLSRTNFIIPKIQKYDCNFAYNENIEHLSIHEVPEDMVVIFMSEGEWNLSGGEELLKNIETISTYVLLSDGTIWRCRFPEREILRYNKKTKESYRVQLRWNIDDAQQQPNSITGLIVDQNNNPVPAVR